jgi:hypothetical protein
MNPWMSQQLGAAHRSELQRVAAQHEGARTARLEMRSTSSRRPMTTRQSPSWSASRLALVGRARAAVGALLVRAGRRLAGEADAVAC